MYSMTCNFKQILMCSKSADILQNIIHNTSKGTLWSKCKQHHNQGVKISSKLRKIKSFVSHGYLIINVKVHIL